MSRPNKRLELYLNFLQLVLGVRERESRVDEVYKQQACVILATLQLLLVASAIVSLSGTTCSISLLECGQVCLQGSLARFE